MPTHTFADGVNLFRLVDTPQAVLQAQGLTPRQIRMGEQLFDGFTDEGVGFVRESSQWVIDLGQVVSPDEVIVHLTGERGSDNIGDIELLSSIASPDTGFQLLRRGRVTASKSRISLKFQSVGTRWLMVRFIPSAPSVETQLSELELIGHPGAPATDYAFNESPASALQVINELKQFLPQKISGTERALFADAADGTLDEFTLAEAALLASGVTDDGERRALLAQISDLESAFNQSSAKSVAQSPAQLGRNLLEWMHQGVLAAGYQELQTNLDVLLGNNTYNCVSSAALYAILARRVGLDVRGVEVPDHAFAIFYDGSMVADIETTTQAGFDTSRNRTALKAFESTTGYSYIPDKHPEKRRELSPLGLMSLIYYNHGVTYTQNKEYQNALVAYFSALSLDSGSQSAAKNVLATLTNWSSELLNEQAFDKALAILRVGLTLAPDDRSLNHNYRVVWQHQVHDASRSDDIASFIDLVNRAGEAIPDAGFGRQQSLYVISRAEKLVDATDFAGALAKTNELIASLNTESQKEVQDYQLNLVLRWANKAIESSSYDDALLALKHGLEIEPDSRKIKRSVAYLLQEWSEAVHASSGEQAAENVVVRIREQFPTLKGVERASRNYAMRRIYELSEQKQYTQALDLVQDYRQLIGSDQQFNKVVRHLFDSQANVFVEDKNWPAAIGVYAKATGMFPDNRPLQRNFIATWHEWAKGAMDVKDWPAAVDIYRQGLLRLPAERTFANNVKFIAQEWLSEMDPNDATTVAVIGELRQQFVDVSGLGKIFVNYYMKSINAYQQQGAFEEAESVALFATDVLDTEREQHKVLAFVYDSWARSLIDAKKWPQAVAVYDKALVLLATNSRVRQNAIATWHMWAKVHMDEENWDAAIDVYHKGLLKMPETALFKQNIKYCEQQRG